MITQVDIDKLIRKNQQMIEHDDLAGLEGEVVSLPVENTMMLDHLRKMVSFEDETGSVLQDG